MTPSYFALAAVIGWPISHSRSPRIHNHWLKLHGINGTYLPLAVAPGQLDTALKGLPALGFRGCNITLPHKIDALKCVHDIDANARRMGAINTVVVQADGSLKGYNNDGFGFIQALLDGKPDWRADAGPITVLGAGGAARAVVLSLADRGAKEIRLINRTLATSHALAQEFGTPVVALPWSERHSALADISLLVNTTSLGMDGKEPLDLDLAALPAHAYVCDVIYAPLETPLLAAARLRGNATVNGLGMLLHQARPAFAAWFGVMPEVTDELRRAVLD
jgi:shikimate dehydrogenase